MRTRTRIATVIASGVLATALLASPSLAAGQRGGPAPEQTSPRPQSTQVAGTCDGTGTGRQGRDAGRGRGTGTRADLTGVPSGTLTDAQRSALAAVAEDEKLAHDLYVAFADLYTVPVFDRIATAETQHLAAVRLLLDRYDLADPTIGLEAGTFATASFQQLYDTQLTAGSADLAAAYEVGVLIEETDIADLKAAAVDLAAPDVERVYANLLAGSERHLAAFGG